MLSLQKFQLDFHLFWDNFSKCIESKLTNQGWNIKKCKYQGYNIRMMEGCIDLAITEIRKNVNNLFIMVISKLVHFTQVLQWHNLRKIFT